VTAPTSGRRHLAVVPPPRLDGTARRQRPPETPAQQQARRALLEALRTDRPIPR
jgi:hypothetical protein